MIKMKSNKKKITMAIGMALGVTVLAGATFASYNTSNGYDVAKTAVKGLMKNENYTANMTTKISLDSKEISSDTLKELYDRNIISSTHYDGEKRTLVEENASEYLNLFGGFDKFYTEDANEDKRNQKMVNFVELIGDTMIGDLKNNIIYVSGDDNSSTYEMNLDAIQIPEVANAGLSAMFSENIADSDDDSDPYILLGTDPIVKNVSVKFTVDNEGRFTNLNAEASMVGNDSNGEKHEATVNITLDMSDYGTTKPERVDISTLPNVEYSDNSEVHTYYGYYE